MDTNQKINQIMQALGMREEYEDPLTHMWRSKPTIIGEQRIELVNKLVILLIEVE